MDRQAPGGVGGEHAILQHELLRVGPVVGDLPIVVVAHDVRRCQRVANPLCELCSATAVVGFGNGDEAVHLPAVDVYYGVEGGVPAAAVDQLRVMIRFVATAGAGVGHTNGELTIFRARQAVGPGVGTEVVIKRTVLLHDHDDVPDLVEVIGRGGARGNAAFRRLCH